MEYGKVSNKKVVGDAYYLNRIFNVGFIVTKAKLDSLTKLIIDLGDFKKVHVINAIQLEEEIQKKLKDLGFI